MGLFSFGEKIKIEVVLSGSEMSEIERRMAVLRAKMNVPDLRHTFIDLSGIDHVRLYNIADEAMIAARELNKQRAHPIHKEDSDLHKILTFIVFVGTHATPILVNYADTSGNPPRIKAIREFLQGVKELAIVLDDAIKRFMYEEIAFLRDLQTQKATLEATLAKLH
ncbi:hypothetical protein HYW21_03680 [Candidatus Woesearchaeota archaeon]|nr:hypothetical protein [Candidatus Woesearchaeota archaeon]